MKRWILLAAGAAGLCAQAPVPAAQAPIPGDTVVATVDGKPLTAGELRNIMAAAPRFLASYKTNPQETIRDYFVVHEMGKTAEQLNLMDKSPWKEQLENLRLQFENARMDLLANAAISNELNSYPVPEEQAQKYYEANRGRFEEATVKIIVIRFRAGDAKPKGTADTDLEAAARAVIQSAHSPDRSEEEAKKLADLLAHQARGGVDFAKLAAENSDDAETKNAGGDFGSISMATSYVPIDLRRAALALKPGEVSDPVKVAVAYYIVRCEKKSTLPLTQVHSQVLLEIRQQHRDEFIKQLQKRYTPAVENPAALIQLGIGK
jgi:parvulin-like peptidyl-prolyl isomerase